MGTADGLGFILKDDPETCHRNFDPPRRGWLSRFGTPRGIIWIGTWVGPGWQKRNEFSNGSDKTKEKKEDK